MGRGSSKAGGNSNGSTFETQAKQNIKGLSGYTITTSTGDTLDMYFMKNDDGETFYKNSLSGQYEQTPNSWTEKEVIARVEENGGTVKKYSKTELLEMETKRLSEKAQRSRELDLAYARNKGADQGEKAYRNTMKAAKMQKRNNRK